MDSTDFRQQLANEFSATTACSPSDSHEILFGNKKFDGFDLAFGQAKLDLVKSQLQFFETCILTNDTESAELVKDMLVEAQQTIFDYAVILLKNNKISKAEFKSRAKAFADATSNSNLKQQATIKAEKILGESLSFQYV